MACWVNTLSLKNIYRNYDELAKLGPYHLHVLEILAEGVRAADPQEAVKHVVGVSREYVVVGDRVYSSFNCVHVIGFGKASHLMAHALHDLLGDRICGGLVISPLKLYNVGSIKVFLGDHPLPGDNTLYSTQALLDYLRRNIGENDLVFILISGGGSALFEKPVEPLSINDIRFITYELMRRGADIYELNIVRKHLSSVKGGRLLKHIKAKHIVSLIVSDVIGDRLDVIASGPTAPDPSTFHDVYRVLRKYGLWDRLPEHVKRFVVNGLKGLVPDTLKPGDRVFEKVYNVIVANNYMSLKAMALKARKLGYNPFILTPFLHGEAREAGRVLASIAWSIGKYGVPVQKPAALIAGGETTVYVRGRGVGGRNQELCLSLFIDLMHVDDVKAVFGCMGSDGVDGNSPAAGALIDNYILPSRLGDLDPNAYLEDNDSYSFFNKLGRAIVTGYTGTNVGDFVAGLII